MSEETHLRDLLVSLGLQEVVTYRMTSPEREARLFVSGLPLPDASRSPETSDYVKIANPITPERSVLRKSLLTSVLEVAEKNGTYLVTAELPGVKKEDINVTVDGAQVTLAAEVKREKEAAEHDRLLHSERSFGKVTRTFTLPQELDEAKVEAKFRDGVLELALPKKTAAPRKQITIQ